MDFPPRDRSLSRHLYPAHHPIDPHEEPDLASLRRLVDFQLRSGVHGLWAMGTTAEFASFSADERAAAIETVIDTAAGRVPVIANVSDASTRATIEHGRRALRAGADGIAATPPYYYPHSQDELLVHYRVIRQAVDLPCLSTTFPRQCGYVSICARRTSSPKREPCPVSKTAKTTWSGSVNW
jgi:4-hydroxy-tetrahydrodipicolinate synthase